MVDRRIKFRHIQSFVEIAREQSLKRAAKKLYLSQPAISKTLKELEEIIGATLMQRSRSGVVLTRQGEVLVGRMGRPDSMQGISFTQLYNEEVVLVVRLGHPLLQHAELSRISEWPVIYPPEGAAIRPLVERLLIANGVGELPHRIETVSGAFSREHVTRTDAVWFIRGRGCQ